MPEKQCPKCHEVKNFSDFYRNRHSKTNTSPYCKVCSNARTTSYARSNQDKIQPKLAGYALKRRYGIGIEEYEQILISQNYSCAICGTTEDKSGRNFAVDHNHTTKQIRGLLCSNCNTSLGGFQDNTELLQKAINYLERFKCTI